MDHKNEKVDEPRTSDSRNPKSYFYVGSKTILEETDLNIGGNIVSSVKDIKGWIESRPEEIVNGVITATFVISENEELIISGRHTEHVMCAKGRNVLSAGEIVFEINKREIYVSEISNQSTGYCPKPESWSIVESVLDKIQIDHPEHFTSAFEFRLCAECKSINLIKDDNYECLVCNSELDKEWNFDKRFN